MSEGAAGIVVDDAYLTDAIKHFKWRAGEEREEAFDPLVADPKVVADALGA